MDTLNESQISIFEKQCGYVPFLMNKSKAVRSYIKGVLLKFILFIFLCALLKWNESFLPLLIVYSIFLIIDTYLRAFSVMKKHMINHLDKAVIHARGVVAEKRHVYPKGLIRFLSKHSKDDQDINQYKYHFYSELKVLIPFHGEQWFPCTSETYARAASGDPAVILEFPEAYELGTTCCFLALDE